MNRATTRLMIALAIVSTIVFAAVVGIVRFSRLSSSDGIEAYAGGISEIFLLLLVAALVMTFAVFVLFVLLRKDRS